MTAEEAAAEIRALEAVRPRGGGTKLGWSPQTDAVDFDTRRFNRILEHNEGDFTAILEAGVPLAEAQATFAAAGQMLAIDPPLGADDAATIGGVMATNDAGPLRHRSPTSTAQATTGRSGTKKRYSMKSPPTFMTYAE